MKDPGITLVSGDLAAVFLPALGMLGASLRHRGVELLRRIEDLDAAAANGSTAGIPLLYPWANRLEGLRYRTAGKDVALDPESRLLHFDGGGLPIHGVPWSRLDWQVTHASRERLAARLDWKRTEWLAVFPFPHRLDLVAELLPDRLTLETTLTPTGEDPVPVSFGFHPYVGIPDVPRRQWELVLPAMRRLLSDGRGIPTGEEAPFGALAAPLGGRGFDDGFATEAERTSLGVQGGGRRLTVELLSGFPYAQVYAPEGKDFLALEPMTAPANALASGRGLRVVEPGGTFRAAFGIRVEDALESSRPGRSRPPTSSAPSRP